MSLCCYPHLPLPHALSFSPITLSSKHRVFPKKSDFISIHSNGRKCCFLINIHSDPFSALLSFPLGLRMIQALVHWKLACPQIGMNR